AHEPTHQIYDLMAASERGVVIPMERTGIDVPPAVENVVRRLLRRDPEERFQSARELRKVLSRLADGGGLADAGVLRIRTDEPGVEVEVRSGRRTVSRGPTPCVASGLGAGSYRILHRDPRFEPVETAVEVGEGATEEVTLVTTPRRAGIVTVLRRRAGVTAAAVGLGLLIAGLLVVRPWGRVLDLAAFATRAEAGEITSVRLASGSLMGRLELGFLTAPVRAPLAEGRRAAAVEALREAGVVVDASLEVDRLIEAAAEAQREMRYFGEGRETVRNLAQRALALDPESEDAVALLRKVAERMAWDADAALGEGAPERARELVDECLGLVDGYPRCVAVTREL
ncbi:MAG: hypothetical protein GWM92_20070, partial [Gemmatimonadetes bacterium]|nr:hypothetical protein [Gemmatimonadota bacterium]NIR81122.1 hypothetical protein [Gemmatimonadota bacterium]NIT89946.1 hypothetical protein [Gemmatimonadota bacterium]NIU33747.1 hypothetical protein [Gemmatimonadota bacterium]NIU37978.1 hypothetical protein [Gemmatimonadota bacterium]